MFRMTQGQVGRFLGCGLLGLVATGCGPGDSDPDKEMGPKMGAATADCGTVQEPLVLTLKDVTPAAGSSVPNADIVQSFTIVGKRLQLQPSFAGSAAHTAGSAIPSPLTWTLALSGGDSVYTTVPMSWATAPGHVELIKPELAATDDGCVFALPTPTFSYDITAP
jgi:hypothetical protein